MHGPRIQISGRVDNGIVESNELHCPFGDEFVAMLFCQMLDKRCQEPLLSKIIAICASTLEQSGG